ncbi:MAG: hypothetical protein ABSG79_18675, partial [Bryobacteraceae bacterium]
IAHEDGGYRPHVRVNVLGDGLQLAGFQMTLTGRFWVTPEDPKPALIVRFGWTRVRRLVPAIAHGQRRQIANRVAHVDEVRKKLLEKPARLPPLISIRKELEPRQFPTASEICPHRRRMRWKRESDWLIFYAFGPLRASGPMSRRPDLSAS